MLTRRSFLTTTAAAAALASARPALAIDPIKRHGAQRMKLSIAAYSFRDSLTGAKKSMTLEDFVNRAAEWPIDAVEPTSYYFPDPATPEYCRRLRRQAFLLGLGISGTAIRNTFTHPPGPALDKEIAHVKHWIDLAVHLGAPATCRKERPKSRPGNGASTRSRSAAPTRSRAASSSRWRTMAASSPRSIS